MTHSQFSPSPSYSITIRVEIENRIGMFARIATAISSAGGDMGAVDIVGVEKNKILKAMEQTLDRKGSLPKTSPYGNGTAASKIIEILTREVN